MFRTPEQSKLDKSLYNAYREIQEKHQGHAAGDSDAEKQASQLASDVKYKAKSKSRPGMGDDELKRIYLRILGSSPANSAVKAMAKKKLIGEHHQKDKDGNVIEHGDGTPSSVEEAKVDAGKSPETKEKDRNVRKFGVSHNVAGHGKLRRSLHRMNRGDKKIKGDKSAWVEMESSQLGEEGYDHMRDKHLERGGIGAVGSKSPSRPYTRSEKQPKGKTVLQKETEAKYGKGKSALDIVKADIKKKYGKGAIMGEENLSELKNSTLLSYSQKATNQLAFSGDGKKKAQKRATGIKAATGKLAIRATDPDGKMGLNKNPKNEETAPAVDMFITDVREKVLDKFETSEKERIVKGMKKDTKGFKKRYGKDWKNVMYATATKSAKKAGDTSKSDKRYAYESSDWRKELREAGCEVKEPPKNNKKPLAKGSKISPKSPNVVIMPPKDEMANEEVDTIINHYINEGYQREDIIKVMSSLNEEPITLATIGALLAKGGAMAAKGAAVAGKVGAAAAKGGAAAVKSGAAAAKAGATAAKSTVGGAAKTFGKVATKTGNLGQATSASAKKFGKSMLLRGKTVNKANVKQAGIKFDKMANRAAVGYAAAKEVGSAAANTGRAALGQPSATVGRTSNQ